MKRGGTSSHEIGWYTSLKSGGTLQVKSVTISSNHPDVSHRANNLLVLGVRIVGRQDAIAHVNCQPLGHVMVAWFLGDVGDDGDCGRASYQDFWYSGPDEVTIRPPYEDPDTDYYFAAAGKGAFTCEIEIE